MLQESQLSKFMVARHHVLSEVQFFRCSLEEGGSWSSLNQKLQPYYPGNMLSTEPGLFSFYWRS